MVGECTETVEQRLGKLKGCLEYSQLELRAISERFTNHRDHQLAQLASNDVGAALHIIRAILQRHGVYR